MGRDAYQGRIYRRTGRVSSTRPLDAVFYALLRDWIPVGKLADLVEHGRSCSPGDPHTFTDGDLARVAMRLARRVTR